MWEGEKRLVVWSGGCDSTAALIWALRAKNAQVRTISFDHFQLGAMPEQKRARAKIKKKLQKKYGHFSALEYSLGDVVFEQGEGLIQPLMWITSSCMALQNDEDLMVGWVKSDDLWHYKEEVFTLFQTCQKLLGKKGKLLCPCEWYDKSIIFEALKEDGVLTDVFWCEKPTNGRVCYGRKCPSCKTHNMYKLTGS